MFNLTKRFFDIVFSLTGIIVIIPLSIIIKLLFLCTGDFGNIMYRQRRVGKGGKIIEIFKYRTMVKNADELLEDLLKDDRYKKEWEETQKLENDPRITKIGKLLRMSSLDELPQCINVLMGDMSLVGPRPLIEGELELHGGTELYWKVKPGITGWWATHGRSDIDYKERLELEYYYIRNQSLKLDLICILKTIGVVLKQEGAK
ncbi:MAG: sugar transferase [Bacteroidaceae bacterium]|nr:sugar transferase [Bacteroidaceae bacterium]